MAQFQIKNWDDFEHDAAKLVAVIKRRTLHSFIVEAIREKVEREGPRDLVAAMRKQRAEEKKK